MDSLLWRNNIINIISLFYEIIFIWQNIEYFGHFAIHHAGILVTSRITTVHLLIPEFRIRSFNSVLVELKILVWSYVPFSSMRFLSSCHMTNSVWCPFIIYKNEKEMNVVHFLNIWCKKVSRMKVCPDISYLSSKQQVMTNNVLFRY